MTRKLSLGWLAAGLLVLLPATSAIGDEGTLLRLKVKPGEVYRYGMSQEMQLEMSMGQMGSQRSVSRNRVEVSYEVASVAEDGTIVINSTFVRTRVETDSPAGVAIMDTADPPAEGEESSAASVMRAMNGKTIQIVLTSRGEVLDVRGFDQLWAALGAGAKDNPTYQYMIEALKESFGPETIRQGAQQSIPLFPQEPVTPGSGWTQSMAMDVGTMGGMKASTSYTMRGASTHAGRDCLELATTVQLSADGEPPLLDQMRQMFAQQGATADVDWKFHDSSGQGSLWLDRETGMVVENTSDLKMAMDMNMAIAKEGQRQEQMMSMTMDMHITFQLLAGPTTSGAPATP